MSDLIAVFSKLKEILQQYEPPFSHKTDTKTGFDLWSFRDVEISGRKYPELFFGAVTARGKYVSLYNMAIYMNKELTEGFSPALKKKLSGKSCFHLTELNESILSEIEDLFQKSFRYYKDNGWV